MGLYFVGFGIYSSNVLREKFSLKDHEQAEKTIVLDVAKKSIIYSEKDFHFSNHSLVKELAEKDKIFLFYAYNNNIRSSFPEIKEQSVIQPFYSSLFSRPPPTII